MIFLFNIFKKKLDKKCVGLFIAVDINFQNINISRDFKLFGFINRIIRINIYFILT